MPIMVAAKAAEAACTVRQPKAPETIPANARATKLGQRHNGSGLGITCMNSQAADVRQGLGVVNVADSKPAALSEGRH
jgi:hypothetical protein